MDGLDRWFDEKCIMNEWGICPGWFMSEAGALAPSYNALGLPSEGATLLCLNSNGALETQGELN